MDHKNKLSRIEKKMSEKPFVEQELRLSKSDLIDLAFHIQELDFIAAIAAEERALEKFERDLENDVRSHFEKHSKVKTKKVAYTSWDDGSFSIEIDVAGFEFSSRVSARKVGKEFAARCTELKKRQKALASSADHLHEMKKSRGHFKREYLSRLLDSTPEGKKILAQLKTVTFKLGEAPRLPIAT
jgi:hypothetical protein